jgi:hypothetical protein
MSDPRDMSYEAVMSRKAEIMRHSVGIDYSGYRTGRIGFDYEKMLSDPGYSVSDIASIQGETAVGNTPLVELKNITDVVRATAPAGKGAADIRQGRSGQPFGVLQGPTGIPFGLGGEKTGL